ncbi:MAG: dicarboxylate/amino acid:cation symporter, partial [Longimicrobiales bacterium]
MGTWILISMIIGGVVGGLLGERAGVFQPVGDLFIRLLIMAAVPLVFFNLLAGLTSLTDLSVVGRLAGKIIGYYLLTTTFALTLGLAAMHFFRPGAGIQLTEDVGQSVGQVPDVFQVVLDLVPENIFLAFAEGRVGQVVVFAVLLGVATVLLPPERREALARGYDLAAEVLRKLVDLILWTGPIGIGALAAATVGTYGTMIFGPLARFLLAVWSAQAVMVLVYLTLLRLLAGRSPIEFLKVTGPLWATTAATCSSLASLVVAFEVAEERLKLPRSVYSFTLPLGAQLNKDGTSIMLAGVLLF